MIPSESAIEPLELSSEQQHVILNTLQSVVSSPHFSKSKRLPAFLDFAVRAALEEDSSTLKERTVGVRVFGRPVDYETASDPVVRIAAGEVRKRMALYFSEHPEAPVHIDLPVGSYKAKFHFRPPTFFQQPKPQTLVDTNLIDTNPVIAAPGAGGSLLGSSPAVREPKFASHRWRTSFVVLSAMLLLIVVGALSWSRLHNRGRQEFWLPVLKVDEPALILMGKRASPAPASTAGNRSQATANESGGPQIVVLDDAIVAGQICSVFREYGRDCNIAPASVASVENIRNKSVVLIGGFNNAWTLRLLAPLEYTIQRNDAKGIRSIIEHQPSGDVPIGTVGDDVPSLQPSKDYAIVARFHSDTTDGMVVVVAGLGIPGTGSAGQYVSTPEKVNEILARAPKGWGGVNFEAVIQTDVVQGTAGHSEVIASHFW
jgi:hypothetical protein